MRILLVEDDATGASWAKSALESLGHAVQIASTRGDALAAIAVGGIDAVITDLVLEPDTSTLGGIEVAEAAAKAGVAVSLVTGYPSAEYREKAPALAARGIMCRSKPYEIAELAASLCKSCAANASLAASCVHHGSDV